MTRLNLLFLFLLIPLLSCGKEEQALPTPIPENPNSEFSNPIDLGEIKNNVITEASGIAASRKNPDALWTHNDSGTAPVLFLINTKGESVASFYIDGITNRDWEDIALGPGPTEGETFIYIGETGDNQAVHPTYKIYRIPEPQLKESHQQITDTLRQVEVIEFVYPDGKRDAETIMIDPVTKDLYIISKRDEYGHIYRAAFPQSTSKVTTLEKTGQLPTKIVGIFEQIVGGDISADGNEILLKSYVQVFYWKRKDENTSVTELLETKPKLLPYMAEPQGEAIGFAADGSGYYTVSEEQSNVTPHLYFYQREE